MSSPSVSDFPLLCVDDLRLRTTDVYICLCNVERLRFDVCLHARVWNTDFPCNRRQRALPEDDLNLKLIHAPCSWISAIADNDEKEETCICVEADRHSDILCPSS